jgi:hypothetical protein
MADSSKGDGASSPEGCTPPPPRRRKPRGPRPKPKYRVINELQLSEDELARGLLRVINAMSPRRQDELAKALLRDAEEQEAKKKMLGDSRSEG